MANLGWLNINNGYVVAAPVAVTGTLVSASATVALSGSITAPQGALVTAGTLGTPRFLASPAAASNSITLNATAGVNGTVTLDLWNYPVAIGNEWTATLASGAALTSSTAGWRAAGTIAPATDCIAAGSTVEAPLADVFFIAGASVTPGAGAVISGWFEKTPWGTAESQISTPGTTVAAQARAPDFVIPLDAAAFAANNFKQANGDIELPSGNFYTIIQNNAGIVLPIGCAIIICPKQLQAA